MSELSFITSRSGGPGGQNVNKVNSKVTLKFDISNSQLLTAEQKQIISEKLASRLTSDGVISVTVQESRSQLENKTIALKKFDALLSKVFEQRKARKKTKPSASSKMKRLKKKRVISEKKKWRRRPPGTDI